MEKISVETMIRNAAITPIKGRLNLVQYKKEKAKAVLHKSVCESIVAFADANKNIPFYGILSMGVGTGSFKKSEYNKGYKSFDGERVSTIYSMANLYNTTMGIKGKPSDVVIRLATRYYNRVSHSIEDFATALANANTMDGKRGHFKELCSNMGIE